MWWGHVGGGEGLYISMTVAEVEYYPFPRLVNI